MAKEKAQIAFEAFYNAMKTNFRGDLPLWDKLSETDKNAWREAVKAVLPERQGEIAEKAWALFLSKYDPIKTPEEIKTLGKRCKTDAGTFKDILEGVI